MPAIAIEAAAGRCGTAGSELSVPRGHLRDRVQSAQGRLPDRPYRARRRALPGM